MRISNLISTAALLILPLSAPMTVYADTTSGSSGASVATPVPTTNASNGLYVSGDVVLSGICQVEGQFRPGQMLVFRAQVLETDGTTISNPTSVTATTKLASGASVKMSYHGGNMWVGTYVIPLDSKPGVLPYTISAVDASGHKGLFVPLGTPPVIVNGNVTINLNGTKVGSFNELDASVPLYPIIQLMKSQGLETNWNGKTLSVNSSIFKSQLPPATGNGPFSIVVNGQTAFKASSVVLKDSSTHNDTTYVSANILEFLVSTFGTVLKNPHAASFDGYELNINTQPAASAPATSSSGSK